MDMFGEMEWKKQQKATRAAFEGGEAAALQTAPAPQPAPQPGPPPPPKSAPQPAPHPEPEPEPEPDSEVELATVSFDYLGHGTDGHIEVAAGEVVAVQSRESADWWCVPAHLEISILDYRHPSQLNSIGTALDRYVRTTDPRRGAAQTGWMPASYAVCCCGAAPLWAILRSLSEIANFQGRVPFLGRRGCDPGGIDVDPPCFWDRS
jgi:hypothetical protein